MGLEPIKHLSSHFECDAFTSFAIYPFILTFLKSFIPSNYNLYHQSKQLIFYERNKKPNKF